MFQTLPSLVPGVPLTLPLLTCSFNIRSMIKAQLECRKPFQICPPELTGKVSPSFVPGPLHPLSSALGLVMWQEA